MIKMRNCNIFFYLYQKFGRDCEIEIDRINEYSTIYHIYTNNVLDRDSIIKNLSDNGYECTYSSLIRTHPNVLEELSINDEYIKNAQKSFAKFCKVRNLGNKFIVIHHPNTKKYHIKSE